MIFWIQLNDIVWHHEWEDFEEWMNKYGPENHEEYAKWYSVGSYLEGIGVLVKRNLIDIDLVDDLLEGVIIDYWNKNEPIR